MQGLLGWAMVWPPATVPASISVIKRDRIYSFGFTVVSDDNTYNCCFEYRKADGEFAKGNGSWVNFEMVLVHLH